VIERHDLAGCDHDHGLQLDVAHHRASSPATATPDSSKSI
jgi:hypothetical protein